MRILLMTDVEGVAGVSTFYVDTRPGGDGYAMAKRLLTQEVNAAVRGFVAAGAAEVGVIDGHGPGAIDFELLEPPARLLHGRPLPPLRHCLGKLAARYDAVAMIGQHAMAGADAANLNHTQNSETVASYTLNGRLIGEIAQCAAFFGAFGLPLIFLSGDTAAVAEARELLPRLVAAEVKEGFGRNAAFTLTAPEARLLIESQAAAALAAHRELPLPPFAPPGPYVLEKRYFHTGAADLAAQPPGAERLDPLTVRLTSDSLADLIYS